MEIEIYRAYLVIESKREKLTRTIAKQFPIRPGNARSLYSPNKEPICKVRGATLGHIATWLYLVQDEEAGLAWEPANMVREDLVKDFRAKGWHVDTPEDVPTVVL